MKISKLFQAFLLMLEWVMISPMMLRAQTLQVELSPQNSKVNRSTDSGIATIFFDSSIEDLSIVCSDQNSNEPIVKLNDHLWFMYVDVLEEKEDVCYRIFNLKCPLSSEYVLQTPEIQPNQVLYYTIVLPNKLEPKVIKALADNVNKLIEDGDYYLARMLALEALPTDLNNPDKQYLPEAEEALRKACAKDNSFFDFGEDNYMCRNGRLLVDDYWHGTTIRLFDIYNGKLLNQMYVGNYGYAINPSVDKIAINDNEKLKIYDIIDDSLSIFYDMGQWNLIEYSPNGKLIAYNSYINDSTIVLKFYDVASGKDKKVIKDNLVNIEDVIFSSDSKTMIAKSDDAVGVWSLQSGECLFNIPNTDVFSSGISFSEDGKYLSINKDGVLQIWDIEKKTNVQTIDFQGSSYSFTQFSHDGKMIVTAVNDYDNKEVKLWDVGTGSCLLVCEKLYSEEGNVCATFSENEDLIASSNEMTIHIRDIKSKDIQKQFDVPSTVKSMMFTEDGNSLIVQTQSGMYLYDIRDNKNVFEGISNYDITAISNDLKLVAFKTDNNSVEIINTKNGKLISRIDCPDYDFIDFMEFDNEGKSIIINYLDSAYIYDVVSGQCLNRIIDNDSKIRGVSFSKNGKIIAIGTEDCKINLYETKTLRPLKTIDVPLNEWAHELTSVKFSSDDTKLIVPNRYSVYILSVENGECLDSIRISYLEDCRDFGICVADLSADEKYILTLNESNYGNVLRVWNRENEGVVYYSETGSDKNARFTSDGKNILIVDSGELIYFPPLQQLIDETRERFKDRKFTDDEMKLYHLE